MKKPLALLALALALGLAGCQPGTTTTSSGTDPDTSDTGGSSTVDVTDTTETDSTPEQTLTVEITSTVTTVEAGKTITLSANIVNGEQGDKVTWSSGDTAVATIDANTGVLTGVAAGTATITAACGEATDTVEITVTPAIPAELASGTSFYTYLKGQAEATVSSISYMNRQLRPSSEKPETTRYVSKMTKDEILREYDNTGTWDEGKHSSYTAIIGSTYYEIDTYGSGRGSRRAILPGDSEAEFSEAVARQNLEMTQNEGDLHGILAEDEALAAWKADRNVEGALKELNYQVDVDGGNYIVTYEAAYEHQDEDYEYENCVHYQVTATLNSEKEIIDLTAEETRATISQWDFETHSPKADASSVYEYTYSVEDIVYVDELPNADPDDLLLDPTAYFVSEVTKATLDMTMATGKDDDGNPVFQVGDRIWLDETTIEYLPATALDADSLKITGYYDSTTGDSVEGAAITDMYGRTTWAKPGTYDIAIGNAYDADMGRIEGVVVTGEEVEAPNVLSISDIGSGIVTDNGDGSYEVVVEKGKYPEVLLNTDAATITQEQLDLIDWTLAPQVGYTVEFMAVEGMAAIIFGNQSPDGSTSTLTINNPDGSKISITLVDQKSDEEVTPPNIDTVSDDWGMTIEPTSSEEGTSIYDIEMEGDSATFFLLDMDGPELTAAQVAAIEYTVSLETALNVQFAINYDMGMPAVALTVEILNTNYPANLTIYNPDGTVLILNFTIKSTTPEEPLVVGGLTDGNGTPLTPIDGTDNEYAIDTLMGNMTTVILLADDGHEITDAELNGVEAVISPDGAASLDRIVYNGDACFDITPNYDSEVGDKFTITIINPDESTIIIRCTVTSRN